MDLGEIVKRGQKFDLTASYEPDEDGVARRAKDEADAALKRKMSLVLFIFSLGLIGVVFGGCVYTFAAGNPDDKKWAAGIVSAITSGLVGFLVGQSKK